MYTVTMQKECKCFKESDFLSQQNFESKDAALKEALDMAKQMSETFCKKHVFGVVEEGNDLVVTMDYA